MRSPAEKPFGERINKGSNPFPTFRIQNIRWAMLTNPDPLFTITSKNLNNQISVLYEHTCVILIGILISLLILPKGTVKNEGIFFAMLTVLIALIVIAVILRKRSGKEEG